MRPPKRVKAPAHAHRPPFPRAPNDGANTYSALDPRAGAAADASAVHKPTFPSHVRRVWFLL
jgi:hypothetical protein